METDPQRIGLRIWNHQFEPLILYLLLTFTYIFNKSLPNQHGSLRPTLESVSQSFASFHVGIQHVCLHTVDIYLVNICWLYMLTNLLIIWSNYQKLLYRFEIKKENLLLKVLSHTKDPLESYIGFSSKTIGLVYRNNIFIVNSGIIIELYYLCK